MRDIRERERWLMEAKEAGYPLCPQCHEPLPKRLHGVKGAICPFCQRIEERIAARTRRRRSYVPFPIERW